MDSWYWSLFLKGSIIPVVLDITANHQGHFTFSLCPNNDIWADPDQDCFDRQVTNRRTERILMLSYASQICVENGEGRVRGVSSQWLHHRDATGVRSSSKNVSKTINQPTFLISFEYSTSLFNPHQSKPEHLTWNSLEQNYWGSESRQIVSGPLTTPIVWWEFTDFFYKQSTW